MIEDCKPRIAPVIVYNSKPFQSHRPSRAVAAAICNLTQKHCPMTLHELEDEVKTTG